MIKFFRKIRQKYLAENKISRYLIYATGEIVLVVIGILIALNINNWNQERVESDKEIAYLNNIQTDLQQQLEYIDIQFEYETRYASLADSLLDKFTMEATLTIDSASSRAIENLTERKTFIKADPSYQDLISTGNIRLIKNDSLRNQILAYYLELERIEKIMQNNNAVLVDELFALNVVHSIYIGEPNKQLLEFSNELLKDDEAIDDADKLN